MAARKAGDAIYVDTSVWCAYCFNQVEAPEALTWLEGVDLIDVASSWWVVTEFCSALGIQRRRNNLNKAQALASHALFDDLMAAAQRLSVTESDFAQAAEWCAHAGVKLRGGDALHLAVAKRNGCSALATLDKEMQAQAQAMGMKVVEWT